MAKYILVVDDDEMMAQVVSNHVRSMGFEAAIALDGLNAAVRIKERKPDLIVMDFKMPGGSGASVSQQLQLSTETKDIPIIFLTAISLEEVRKDVPRWSNVAFLRKPCNADELKAKIAALLPRPS